PAFSNGRSENEPRFDPRRWRLASQPAGTTVGSGLSAFGSRLSALGVWRLWALGLLALGGFELGPLCSPAWRATPRRRSAGGGARPAPIPGRNPHAWNGL